jgi:predicted negative regulator of RcsB-dependent stress response
VQSSELSDITAQVSELKEKYAGSSYAAKAALLRAKQLSVGDMDAAYSELQWVIDNAGESGLQHSARIRQAKIKLAQGDLDAAQQLASYAPTLEFESHYAELLADIASQKGDYAEARRQYQVAIDTLVGGQNGYSQILTIKMNRVPEVPETAASESDSGAGEVTGEASDNDNEADADQSE